MNRHERRKAAKQQRKGKGSDRCMSCGRTNKPQVNSVRDGKQRCLVCHDLHMASTDEDLDPGNSQAAELQKAMQEAIARVVGREAESAALIYQASATLAATYAVQGQLYATVQSGKEPTDADIDRWQAWHVARSRKFFDLVVQALHLSGPKRAPASGTARWLGEQLEATKGEHLVTVDGRRVVGVKRRGQQVELLLGHHLGGDDEP